MTSGYPWKWRWNPWTATTTGKETLVTSPLTLSVPSFLMLYHYPLWFKRGNAETKRFSMWKWSLFNCRFPVSIRFMMISMGFCQNNLTEKPGIATPVGIFFSLFQSDDIHCCSVSEPVLSCSQTTIIYRERWDILNENGALMISYAYLNKCLEDQHINMIRFYNDYSYPVIWINGN